MRNLRLVSVYLYRSEICPCERAPLLNSPQAEECVPWQRSGNNGRTIV